MIRKVRWIRLQRHSPALAVTPRHHRAGAAAVELAVVLPVFLLLIMGIIEFSRALSVSQMLTSATRQYCRKAIIRGESTDAIRDGAVSSLNSLVHPSDPSIAVTIQIDNPDALNLLENAKPGDLVTIKAEVPYQSVKYIPGRFLGGVTLRSQCSMTHE